MKRQILFHRHAAKYLKKMPAERKAQVLDAVRTLATLIDPTASPNVSKLAGGWDGAWRLRVGSYRVIFKFSLPDAHPNSSPPPDVFEVLLIGPRGDIYK